MSMKTMISAALVALLAGSASADPEANERLLKAAGALKEMKSLSYDVHVSMTGFISMEVDGSVEMRRRATGSWEVRREGAAKMGGMGGAPGQETNYLVVSSPSTVLWINMKDQKVVERYARQARDTSVTTADTAWISALNDNDPFAKDLAAPTSAVEGEITLDGVKCDIVFVDEGDKREQRRWFLSQEDHMPRKLEATLMGPGGSVVRTYEVKNFKVNPTLEDARFEIPTPEGFTEERLPKGSNPAAGDPVPQPNAQLIQPAQAARGVPKFIVSTMDGAEFTSDKLTDKVTVLVFGGTWNRAWKMETEALAPVLKDYKDKGVQVVSAGIKQSKLQDMADHFKTLGTEAVVVGGADTLARDIGCKSFPTLFVIDAKSLIVHEERGFNPETTVSAVREAIEKALRGEAPAPQPMEGGQGLRTNSSDGSTTTTNPGDGDR